MSETLQDRLRHWAQRYSRDHGALEYTEAADALDALAAENARLRTVGRSLLDSHDYCGPFFVNDWEELRAALAKEPTSDEHRRKIPNPKNDLYSDAMDSAVSAFHFVRHQAMRNAERSGEQLDGEQLARHALANGIVAYLEELHFPVDTKEPTT